MPVDILLVTKGHGFDYGGFYAIFDDDPELNTTQVEHPAAQVLLRPENVAAYEAVVFYDMWGVAPDANGQLAQPSDDYRRSVEALLDNGVGMVLMNHAMVQWPGWPLWRTVHGSSFMYKPATPEDEGVPRSGFRGGASEPERNVDQFLSPADPSHPVLQGLGDGFRIVDEGYLKTADFENSPDIVPLLRSDYDWVQENFKLPGGTPEELANWKHPRGSNLIAWAKRSGNSPVVASDAGDGPAAYANPQFRRFLSNAIHWVASDEAKAWARGG